MPPQVRKRDTFTDTFFGTENGSSQGQNPALTVFLVPSWLESGSDVDDDEELRVACRHAQTSSIQTTIPLVAQVLVSLATDTAVY